VDSGFAAVSFGAMGYVVMRHVGVGYVEGRLAVLRENPGRGGVVEKKITAPSPREWESILRRETLEAELRLAEELLSSGEGEGPVAVDGSLIGMEARGGESLKGIVGVAKDSSLSLLSQRLPDSVVLEGLLGKGEYVVVEGDVVVAYLSTGRVVLTLTMHRESNVEELVGAVYGNATLIRGFGYPAALAYAHLKAKLRGEHILLKRYEPLLPKRRDWLPFR